MSKGIKVVTANGEVVYVPPGSSVFVNGMEIPDPTPVEMPIGFERPESLESMMLRLVQQVSRGQADIGEESIDDANDFDVDDDELLEDTFTDAELGAIMASPEMKEQFLRADEEKKREQADRDTRRAAGGEEDGDVGEVDESAHSERQFRRRNRERSAGGSDRGNPRVERGRSKRSRESAEDSEDVGERDY